jgi:hypothetical protein
MSSKTDYLKRLRTRKPKSSDTDSPSPRAPRPSSKVEASEKSPKGPSLRLPIPRSSQEPLRNVSPSPKDS